MTAAGRWVLGLDIGGSGSRVALATSAPAAPDAPSGPGASEAPRGADAPRGAGAEARLLHGSRVGIAAAGSSIPVVVDDLLARARTEWPREWERVAAIAVGATGARTLVADPDAVVRSIASRRPGAVAALATDAVTAHLGALDGAAGAVVAVGTGAVALGTDLGDVWRRVDGWGHLLGDRGAGSWIGRQGLETAMRQYDGVETGADALLAAAVERFGPPESWPAQLYTRDDRAGVLGSFAGQVDALAVSGDAVAARIMASAGREVAQSLVAALDPRLPRVVSTVGGVFAAAGPFTEAFTAELAAAPGSGIELRPAAGTPLDGAIRLARLLTDPATTPTPHPEHLWLATPTAPASRSHFRVQKTRLWTRK